MCELTFLTKKWWVPSQLTFTCSKSTTEALKRCKICSKLIKTPERRQWRCCIFTVNFEHITHLCILPQYNHAVVAEVTATTAWLYWGRMQMWLAVVLVGNKLNTELSPNWDPVARIPKIYIFLTYQIHEFVKIQYVLTSFKYFFLRFSSEN